MASSRRREQRPRLGSAVSRLSLSRTKRYRQFPADASSYVLKDEFPVFAHTGDVEITIRGAIAADGVETVSNTYLLHQHILARCSGFFAASDDGDRGGNQDGGDSARNAFGSTRPNRQWKFELDHGKVYLDTPMLVQTDPLPAQQEESARAGDSQLSAPSLSAPGSGGPVALQPEDGPPAKLNGSQRAFDAKPKMREMLLENDKFLLRNYDNLFRIFYNCRPMLGEHVTSTKDYLGWLAVSLFRQWLAARTKPQIESEGGDNHHSDDNNEYNEYKTPPYSICRIFRNLGSHYPSTFLDHHDYEKFLALNPQLHTRENLVYFESRMADLKRLVLRLVYPLLCSNLELDVDKFNASGVMRHELIYFTCSTIEDDEIPWPLEPYIPFD
ncbi:hypothetical protein E4U59_004047 [Claviceps monticola]|nr:hypothetical protein E4U59_004047 [Claviceps monticola]